MDSSKITYTAAENDVSITVATSSNGIQAIGKNHSVSKSCLKTTDVSSFHMWVMVCVGGRGVHSVVRNAVEQWGARHVVTLVCGVFDNNGQAVVPHSSVALSHTVVCWGVIPK